MRLAGTFWMHYPPFTASSVHNWILSCVRVVVWKVVPHFIIYILDSCVLRFDSCLLFAQATFTLVGVAFIGFFCPLRHCSRWLLPIHVLVHSNFNRFSYIGFSICVTLMKSHSNDCSWRSIDFRPFSSVKCCCFWRLPKNYLIKRHELCGTTILHVWLFRWPPAKLPSFYWFPFRFNANHKMQIDYFSIQNSFMTFKNGLSFISIKLYFVYSSHSKL